MIFVKKYTVTFFNIFLLFVFDFLHFHHVFILNIYLKDKKIYL